MAGVRSNAKGDSVGIGTTDQVELAADIKTEKYATKDHPKAVKKSKKRVVIEDQYAEVKDPRFGDG